MFDLIFNPVMVHTLWSQKKVFIQCLNYRSFIVLMLFQTA